MMRRPLSPFKSDTSDHDDDGDDNDDDDDDDYDDDDDDDDDDEDQDNVGTIRPFFIKGQIMAHLPPLITRVPVAIWTYSRTWGSLFQICRLLCLTLHRRRRRPYLKSK